jgi:uncharacterized transporter YbjL
VTVGIAMSADMKSRFRAGAKVCSLAIMILLVIGALGPANWTPRTALGWQIDHFLGYFARSFRPPAGIACKSVLISLHHKLHNILSRCFVTFERGRDY